MIAQAARRNRAAVADGHVALITGTPDDLPPEETFDRIWSVNVIGFVTNRLRFSAALFQRLRPGCLAATTYMPRHKGASTADAAAMADKLRGPMLSAGFADIRIETLPLRPVGAVSVMGRRRQA